METRSGTYFPGCTKRRGTSLGWCQRRGSWVLCPPARRDRWPNSLPLVLLDRPDGRRQTRTKGCSGGGRRAFLRARPTRTMIPRETRRMAIWIHDRVGLGREGGPSLARAFQGCGHGHGRKLLTPKVCSSTQSRTAATTISDTAPAPDTAPGLSQISDLMDSSQSQTWCPTPVDPNPWSGTNPGSPSFSQVSNSETLEGFLLRPHMIGKSVWGAQDWPTHDWINLCRSDSRTTGRCTAVVVCRPPHPHHSRFMPSVTELSTVTISCPHPSLTTSRVRLDSGTHL